MWNPSHSQDHLPVKKYKLRWFWPSGIKKRLITSFITGASLTRKQTVYVDTKRELWRRHLQQLIWNSHDGYFSGVKSFMLIDSLPSLSGQEHACICTHACTRTLTWPEEIAGYTRTAQELCAAHFQVTASTLCCFFVNA